MKHTPPTLALMARIEELVDSRPDGVGLAEVMTVLGLRKGQARMILLRMRDYGQLASSTRGPRSVWSRPEKAAEIDARVAAAAREHELAGKRIRKHAAAVRQREGDWPVVQRVGVDAREAPRPRCTAPNSVWRLAKQ